MINLLQISDIHMGKEFDHRGNALFSGYQSHDVKLCIALDQWLREDVWKLDGISDEDDLYFLMTGDVTANGIPAEFQVANTFMHSEHAIVKNGLVSRIGANQDADLYTAIAGNHDHWNGNWVWPKQTGFSRAIYDQFLEPLPLVSNPICSDGIELRVIGVDSCSMFEEAIVNLNPLAHGGFSEKHKEEVIKRIEEVLSEPLAADCADRVAVLLCHHPFSRDGAAGPLRDSCVKWLSKTAYEYGIGVILTGHTHKAWTNKARIDKDSLTETVRLVRCPTTLQYPARLNSTERRPGLWLHQVYREEGAIKWKGTLLLYSGGSFRTPTKQFADVGDVLDENRYSRKAWFEETLPIFQR